MLTRATAIACATLCLLAHVPAARADWSCNLESGRGRNFQPIRASIPGLLFSAPAGDDVYFADITSGWYDVTSDNGLVYENGEYFVSGYVGAYVLGLGDQAKISFALGPASRFTIGYSSQFPFVLEAYDGAGSLLTSAGGAANVRSQGGTGLAYLTVNHPGIAYVLLHDEGGYWMVDNITTDAPVPEPASIIALLVALGGLAASRRRRSR